MACPNQNMDIGKPNCLNDHVIVCINNVKIKFNLDIESTDKTRSIVKNVGRALINKKC